MILFLALNTGCSGKGTLLPLNANNLNLIFVVSPDLAYQAPGDINPTTGNLTNQGLQRSLHLATFLKQQVMGNRNVNRIYALEPITHLQTENNLPDMAALGYIQQFAMLNKVGLFTTGGYGSPLYTANSYPINVSYAQGDPLPAGVAALDTNNPCLSCQGLKYNDTGHHNTSLALQIIGLNFPGFYVFSAPWETMNSLMAEIIKKQGYNLSLPAAYSGPSTIYVISIAPTGSAGLLTYTDDFNPPSIYPKLPSQVAKTDCKAQKPFSINAIGGENGVQIPAGTNRNETVYMIRHAEAHPVSGWENGNYVAAGQWRALALADALRGKINPTEVWSIDPAQVIPNYNLVPGLTNFSYIRTSLTVEPYAIANNLPFYLVSDLNLFAEDAPQTTNEKFFFGGEFSNKTILLAWEHAHFPPTLADLLTRFYPAGNVPAVSEWPSADYDTIWTVSLDGQGNLSVNNTLCEGIDSSKLPATAPGY